MKVAYCGYDFFSACLSDLLAQGVAVGSVFTMQCDNRVDFNQYIHEICEQYKLPLTDAPVDERTIAQLDADGYDLLITAGYPYKIPDLSKTKLRGINVHPTLLPVGRGPWPLPWVILNKLERSGVTIHALSDAFDAGNIIAQHAFPVSPQETLETLSAKCQLAARPLLCDVVTHLPRYWNTQHPQVGDASYWPRPTAQERTIDWRTDVHDIERMCRAFGKSGTRASFDNHNWWVYSVSGWQQKHRYAPGAVVHKTNTEMIVAAADGLVSLLYFRRILPPAP